MACRILFLLASLRITSQNQNLRRKDGQSKRPPRQVTSIVSRNIPSQIIRTRRIPIRIAVLRSSLIPIRSSQDSNGNEPPDKRKIKQHPKPSKKTWTPVLEGQGHQRGEDGVQDRGSEDPFDGAVGFVDAMAGLDGVGEAVDFVEAG